MKLKSNDYDKDILVCVKWFVKNKIYFIKNLLV